MSDPEFNDITLRRVTTDIATLFARVLHLESLSSGGGTGSIGARRVIEKSANYTINSSDVTPGGWLLVLADTSGGAFTITLPALSSAYDSTSGAGAVINVTNLSTNNATVDGSGAETIDGQATQIIAFQYDNIQMQAGPDEWSII